MKMRKTWTVPWKEHSAQGIEGTVKFSLTVILWIKITLKWSTVRDSMKRNLLTWTLIDKENGTLHFWTICLFPFFLNRFASSKEMNSSGLTTAITVSLRSDTAKPSSADKNFSFPQLPFKNSANLQFTLNGCTSCTKSANPENYTQLFSCLVNRQSFWRCVELHKAHSEIISTFDVVLMWRHYHRNINYHNFKSLILYICDAM